MKITTDLKHIDRLREKRVIIEEIFLKALFRFGRELNFLSKSYKFLHQRLKNNGSILYTLRYF